jgi:hypothetical protein
LETQRLDVDLVDLVDLIDNPPPMGRENVRILLLNKLAIDASVVRLLSVNPLRIR